MTKKRTIGAMTQSRGTWLINPVTRVKQSKRKHPGRHQIKALLKKRGWEE
jgi:hypothetical protein